MKRIIGLLAMVATLAVWAEDPVHLRTLSCGSEGKQQLASNDFGRARLNGLVHEYADGSYRLVWYETFVEVYGDQSSFGDFSVAQGRDVANEAYHPRSEKLRDYVSFPLKFHQGESVSLLFPGNFQAHGDTTAYLRLKDVAGGAYGDLKLICR